MRVKTIINPFIILLEANKIDSMKNYKILNKYNKIYILIIISNLE